MWFRRLAILALISTPAVTQQVPAPSTTGRDLSIDKDPAPARTPPPTATRREVPRSYALIIGIGNYAEASIQKLEFAERDADAMYSILISPEGGNFRAENVRKLVGSKATLANVRRELEQWLPSVAKEGDRVLVYFAGHGFIADSRPYLALYDFHVSNPSGTGYPMQSLGEVFGAKINAKWKVLLTDACHSGSITPDGQVQAINKSLLDLSRSVFSLTASRDRERSYESPDYGGGHGIFTYYVVKGLEGAADESRDGIVTADELAEYVRRNVREATKGAQNPTADRSSFDPDMLLAYIPSNARPGAPPPPKEGVLIVESNMDGVEVFVDGKSAGVINKSQPLTLPGLPPGVHMVKGVKMGYEADGPREETVYPGQETTVTLRITTQRRRNRSALQHLDKGLEFYSKGFAENYKKAVSEFEHALAIDGELSEAALYLARSYNGLFNQDLAAKAFRRAIEIDPDYLEARASFGGMLLDTGDIDEAIRQLNVVVQRDPKHAMAWYLLSQALCRKESYAASIEAAETAVRLTPNNAEAHFWLAEGLRMSRYWQRGRDAYAAYLRLSDFDSKLAGKVNYYVLGYLAGLGKKRRASQQDIWRDLRSWAYFGMCNCEYKMARYDEAIAACQKSLSYDPEDPLTRYNLGLAYVQKARKTGSIETAAAARTQFAAMLNLNPDLEESKYARQNILNIDAELNKR